MISHFEDESWEDTEAQDTWDAYHEWAREKRDDIDDLIHEARWSDQAQNAAEPDQQDQEETA